jgi:hypothetical protein
MKEAIKKTANNIKKIATNVLVCLDFKNAKTDCFSVDAVVFCELVFSLAIET